MSERKPCVRCQRGIDEWARICPFCNQDQNAPVPPPQAAAAPAVEYKPPVEHQLRRKALFAAGGAVLLVLAFFVGVIINRDGAPKRAPETIEEQAQEQASVPAPRRANTPLVPVNEPGGFDQPITSAPVAGSPAEGVPAEYQRSDATAVSAAEYAQLAKRAQAEKKRMAAVVDPRSITGAAYAQGGQPVLPPRRTMRPPAPGAAPAGSIPGAAPVGNVPGMSAPPQNAPPVQSRRAAVRTRPVPQYQPVPPLRARGTARFDLVIGADGRVKEVAIRHPLEGGNTAVLLRAVQSWRFRPATENGEPVAAPFSVEISFGR
ncbi:MAG TPA: energy transducer TonB [Thermoanaerobaculia bacterium]|jgi:hypothetical protein